MYIPDFAYMQMSGEDEHHKAVDMLNSSTEKVTCRLPPHSASNQLSLAPQLGAPRLIYTADFLSMTNLS
jgi:hypothetical protein